MRILLVDDDPLILDSLLEVLSFDGHDVCTASGAAAALDIFRAGSDGAVFDVVITDLGMPGINGLQLIHEIRGLSRSVRVILLTAWGASAREDAEYPASIDYLISKPVRLDELRAALAA
jgi:DNA-binding response OmpR family regulator